MTQRNDLPRHPDNRNGNNSPSALPASGFHDNVVSVNASANLFASTVPCSAPENGLRALEEITNGKRRGTLIPWNNLFGIIAGIVVDDHQLPRQVGRNVIL